MLGAAEAKKPAGRPKFRFLTLAGAKSGPGLVEGELGADATAAPTRLHDEQESSDLAAARPCARRREAKRQNSGLATLGHA